MLSSTIHHSQKFKIFGVFFLLISIWVLQEMLNKYALHPIEDRIGRADLHRFSQNDIVECIDSLETGMRSRRLQSPNSFGAGKLTTVREAPLHVIFIGDSRIRQYFFNFLETLPQHDFAMTPKTSNLHTDRQMKSELLNLLVTFLWRPNLLGQIGDNVTETLHHLIASRHPRKPDLVVIGMGLHDMLIENGANHHLYRKKFEKLRQSLEELSKSSRMMWMSIIPTYDTVRSAFHEWKSSEMFSEKISRYNAIARGILRESNIKFWESSSFVAVGYIRACAMNSRQGGDMLWGTTPYLKCGDYLHPGNVVIIEAMQQFLNDICNIL